MHVLTNALFAFPLFFSHLFFFFRHKNCIIHFLLNACTCPSLFRCLTDSVAKKEKKIFPLSFFLMTRGQFIRRSKRSIPYGVSHVSSSSLTSSVPITHTHQIHDEEAGNLCITYADVNDAIKQAKYKLGGFIPQQIYELSSESPKPAHIAVPAAIMEEATRILATRYGLTRQTILYLLPRVDTTRTVARDICPTFLLPVQCESSKYRTLTGMCNNINYPSWGATRSAMIRMLPPAYADGKSLTHSLTH